MIRSSDISALASIPRSWFPMKWRLIHCLIRKTRKPAHWQCDGGSEYTMEKIIMRERLPGTTVTLHVSEDCAGSAATIKAKGHSRNTAASCLMKSICRQQGRKIAWVIKESERLPGRCDYRGTARAGESVRKLYASDVKEGRGRKESARKRELRSRRDRSL